MKGLERNKQEFRYAAPTGEKEPIVDKQGNLTGEYASGYSEPVTWKGNISAGSGDVEAAPFGSEITYDRIIVLDDPKFPINESSILWIDTPPEIQEDGSTKDPHDYIVKQVATSLNSVSIAVSKVNVRA